MIKYPLLFTNSYLLFLFVLQHWTSRPSTTASRGFRRSSRGILATLSGCQRYGNDPHHLTHFYLPLSLDDGSVSFFRMTDPAALTDQTCSFSSLCYQSRSAETYARNTKSKIIPCLRFVCLFCARVILIFPSRICVFEPPVGFCFHLVATSARVSRLTSVNRVSVWSERHIWLFVYQLEIKRRV